LKFSNPELGYAFKRYYGKVDLVILYLILVNNIFIIYDKLLKKYEKIINFYFTLIPSN